MSSSFRSTPLPDRFRGLPVIEKQHCPLGCEKCLESCPTQAIRRDNRGLLIDLGRCLFCTDCMDACPAGAIELTREYRLASSSRSGLVIDSSATQLAMKVEEKSRRMFGRSLALRHVSAGGCNGCEIEVRQLTSLTYDLNRLGIRFVASPHHADGLLVTGPITKPMEQPLQAAYEAVPSPKLVVAIGACAISGGPFLDHPEQSNGADRFLPVDLYVPGCPPHPLTILDGLLTLLERREQRDTKSK